MAKLPPPILEGTLPAFCADKNGTVKITVPFTMNRGVSPTQVGGFSLKIKTAQSTSYLFDIQLSERDEILGYDLMQLNKAVFTLTEEQVSKLRVSQYYKIQLAYLDKAETRIGADGKEEFYYETRYTTDSDGNTIAEKIYPDQEVGHYSSIGVAKFTTRPDVYIENMTFGLINQHIYNYTGVYSQENYKDDEGNKIVRDVTERVYSYYFKVYNDKEELILESGDIIHNSSNDTETHTSQDTFTLPQDLALDKSYYIKYGVTTTNGLTVSTPKYRIMQKLSIDPEIEATVEATMNVENGYIEIDLVGKKNINGEETPVTGAFLLSRASSDNNYMTWENIARFRLTAQYPTRTLWRDFTIEQGKTYKYSIQQYNDVGLYSNRLYSNEVFSDFDYAFLYDGERQLKIKYNSKVSSFKTTVQESKVETIGSQYPFIFRNGRVYYHEFPISGLISYYMDEENLFLNEEEFFVEEKTTFLTSENIQKERIFKLKVLEWLTDGNPKLFRSPTEGNYIVRLMNCSLSPSDPLGRMLHTFNCTAYEIADYNYEELNNYGFLSINDPECPILRFETVELREKMGPFDYAVTATSGKVNNYPAYQIQIVDVMPGNKFILTFEDGTKEVITIGVTGAYLLDIAKAVIRIDIPEGLKYYQGSVTYGYYTLYENQFDKIQNVLVTEVPSHQFIGDHDVIQELEYIYIDGEWVKNPKVDIIQIYSIVADERIIMQTKRVNGEYQTQNGEIITSPNDFVLYAFGNWTPVGQYNPYITEYKYTIEGYHDFTINKDYLISQLQDKALQPYIQINDNIISMADHNGLYKVEDLGKLTALKIGNGAMADISYQIRTIEYLIENNPRYSIKPLKVEYENAVRRLEDVTTSEWKASQDNLNLNADGLTFDEWCTTTASIERIRRQEVDDAYYLYIKELIKVQKELVEEEG